MEQFRNSCLSCYKPLATDQDTCDECQYIDIKTESLDERLFLLYIKYLEDKGLYLNSLRTDKLSGKSQFDFDLDDAALQFLDDPETTGGLLSHYISSKYPDLFKTKSFAGIGFQVDARTLDEKNIEAVKKNLLEPICQKIKETYLAMDFLDGENNLLRSFILLPELYDTRSKITKLDFTFQHLSRSDFRENIKNYSKTDALEIKGLNDKTSRLEKLMVLKEKGFASRISKLATFIYDLELAMGHIDKCEVLKSQLPYGNDSKWIKLYRHAEYNETLVQLISYKTYFPYLNRDHTKNFRNELNLQGIAETLRTCASKSTELDPWIYLACEEVAINPNVEFDEADTDGLSTNFKLSLSLALNEKLSEKQRQIISTSEEYQNLNWLVGKNSESTLNLSVLSGKRLNVYQLEVFKHQLHSLTLAYRKFAYLQLSDQTKADIFRHFISGDHANQRLFDRCESASKAIINQAFRLMFVVSNDEQFHEQILPNLKEPLVKKMEHENILRLIWQRKDVHLTDTLLQAIHTYGDGMLSSFIAGGPKNVDKIPDESSLHISDAAFDFIVAQSSAGALDIRPINRICLIISTYLEKYPDMHYGALLEMANMKFSVVERFKAK